ncbi:MAG: DNA-directed RNA polymerase subunit omega [Pyrinomonadaceae bacterium]
MSQVQEVSAQLAATLGHRGFSSACVLYRPEAYLEAQLNSRNPGKSESLEKQHLMTNKDNPNGNGLTGVANEGTWPGIDSRFRLIIVAGLRTKQLLHGSKPRIEADKSRRRNTSIAVEEVKRGLVDFTKIEKPAVHQSHGGGLD